MGSMFAWGVFEDGKTYTIKVYVTGNQGVYNQSQGQQGSAIQKTDGDK